MHSLHTQTVTFHYNGDFSGDVIIQPRDDVSPEITVPAEDLLRLVANIVRSRRIAVLEQMDPEQLLGF